jgi:hypothetical protein
LLPLPVNGSLQRAAAVVVMLNSGFGPADQEWDAAHPAEATEREASKWRNLSQMHGASDLFPFYDFNPLFAEHPGAAYWRKKLGGICRALVAPPRVTLDIATKIVANRVAVVQRFAYASTNSSGVASACEMLPSPAAAQALVRGLVSEGEKLVVVVRGATSFGLDRGDETANLVVFDPRTTEPVHAHLGPTTRGGKVLLERLRAADAQSLCVA